MTYHLTVAGECDGPAERELAAKLGELLAQPQYGVSATHLQGREHNGPLHHYAAQKMGRAVPKIRTEDKGDKDAESRTES